MAFGVYVHIPYCLQRCVYCDFATYESSQILAPAQYISRLKKEIKIKGPSVGSRKLDTLYFGGGTPSLLEPELLGEVIEALHQSNFITQPDTEITLEMNPATVDAQKLAGLLQLGFNRFSVGAQTFDESLLKLAHRRHSAQNTRDTLSLLRENGVNFSADLLFALPTQTMEGLNRDIDELLFYKPNHISPYCLTVPESNPMARNRPLEDTQVEMFSLIESRLSQEGYRRYEISNFAKPGFESRHNQIYWDHDEYWGVGLSSHSYLHRFDWGCRFWNTRSIQEYIDEMDSLSNWCVEDQLPLRMEKLEKHHALTDFFHVSLRRERGFSLDEYEARFRDKMHSKVQNQIIGLTEKTLLSKIGNTYALTEKGRLLSNLVFEELTFLNSQI